MEIDFLVQDTFSLVRPNWKLVTDLGEAAKPSDEEGEDGIEEDAGEEKQNDDSDEEEQIVVLRQEEQLDPEAEADFDRAFERMMSESLDSRKFERRAQFDVPLPIRKIQRQPLEPTD